MTEDDKKEVLTSDEKGAAKSTLGGAVAGAVVGTAVGTPVVGTLTRPPRCLSWRLSNSWVLKVAARGL